VLHHVWCMACPNDDVSGVGAEHRVGSARVIFAGGQPVASSPVVVPMDVVVNFSAGSGALTATHFNNGAHGADWGTWQEYHNGGPGANDHTVIEDHAVTLPFQVSCDGQVYDGSEGQGMTFDHSGLPSTYDAYQLNTTGKTGVIAIFLAKFDVALGVSPTSYNNDTLVFAGSNYTVPQFQLTFQNLKRWVSHSEGVTGATVSYGSGWVVIGVHHNASGAVGELYVQDATTRNLIGASRSEHDPVAGSLTYIRLTDYLRLADHGAGSIKIKLLAFRDSDLTFPPYTIPIPTPLSVVAARTGVDEVTVTWTSPCQVFQIERDLYSGGWATLDADHDNKPASRSYVDTALSDGDTVRYRIAAKIGSQTSVGGQSATITVSA
jgi:hypothetical protein